MSLEYDANSGAAIAETPADAAVDAQMAQAPLDLLVPSPTNPRKTFAAGKLAELTDSIRAMGVMSPILVRPLPAQMLQDSAHAMLAGQELLDAWEHKATKLPRPAYEIVAGERRWRASILAQLRTVPIVVRPLTDAQVLEAQLVENLQRDDLHPLEEAEGYQRLCEATGIRKEDIAGKIGKSRSYVYQRLQLLDLAQESREAFRTGKVDASKAQLLATVADPKLQLKALKEFSEEVSYGRTKSVRECRDWLQQNVLLKIKDAPFDTKDAGLVEDCGSCADCPKRTHADRDLFAAFDGPDMCTDAQCFHGKEEAHLGRIRADAEAKGMEVIAGKEAKQLKPHSWNSEIKGYTRLDDKIDGEPISKLVGKDVKPVLFVDPHTHQKVKLLPTDKVTEALKAKGIETAAEQRKQADAQYEAQRRKNEIDSRITKTSRTRAAVEIMNRVRLGTVAAFSAPVLRLLLKGFLEHLREDYDAAERLDALLPLWGLPAIADDEDPGEPIMRHIEAAPDEELGPMVIALLLSRDLGYIHFNETEATDLLAAETGVDVDAIKAQVKAEIKAEEAEKRKAEKAKAAQPAGAKLQAAPQGSKAADDGAAAPKKGRAARAPRTSVEQAKQGIADAMQNLSEPAGAGGFAVGQRVRFKMDLKSGGGKLRKVSGREGTIELAIGDRAFSVRFGEKAHEVATADYTELEAIERVESSDLESLSKSETTAVKAFVTSARNLDPNAAWPFKLDNKNE